MRRINQFLSKYLLVMLCLCPMSMSAKHIISMRDFGVVPSATLDATPGLRQALVECGNYPGSTLVFEKGEYHFWGDKAFEEYCYISNNDEGMKRIIFPLKDLKNLTVDGQGSTFIFHGLVNPFVMENSSEITLTNFSVDFSRTFHNEATIVKCDKPNEIDLRFSKEYPFRIKNNILVFADFDEVEAKQETTIKKKMRYPYASLLEFDTQKRETAYMVRDYYVNAVPLVAKQLSANTVRLFLKGIKGTPGNTMVFGAGTRNYPAFVVTECDDVVFDHVTIHHAGGMGIIAQRSHNVAVLNCTVAPSKGRMVSCTADATHFVNCTGIVELGHSTFMNQMDDATNIHGIYAQIVERVSPKEFFIQLKHPQQYGFDFLEEGTRVEFVRANSLITKGEANVVKVERLNKQTTRVVVDQPIPEGIEVGDVIGDVNHLSKVHIHDNYIGKNRARGMLLNSRGRTIVENNIFHTPGAAILFEGDACHWFEQGGVKNCVIRNNTFDDCLFGVWGKAVIAVGAGISADVDKSHYNSNIKVYGNTFKCFDKAYLLHAYGMDNMKWKNNKVEYTTSYPLNKANGSLFDIKNCSGMHISQGDYYLDQE